MILLFSYSSKITTAAPAHTLSVRIMRLFSTAPFRAFAFRSSASSRMAKQSVICPWISLPPNSSPHFRNRAFSSSRKENDGNPCSHALRKEAPRSMALAQSRAGKKPPWYSAKISSKGLAPNRICVSVWRRKVSHSSQNVTFSYRRCERKSPVSPDVSRINTHPMIFIQILLSENAFDFSPGRATL